MRNDGGMHNDGGMTKASYISVEFPGEVQTIQRLRSVNAVFEEICEDLELLGRDLALFSEEERLQNRGAYRDVRESYQALRQEIAKYVSRKDNTAADE